MNIISTDSLKNSILASTPEVDSTILEELCFLTRKHNLKWVPNKEDNGAYYIMSQLSVAKGLDPEDYRKHWSPEAKSTPAAKGRQLESLPGKAFLLKGKSLARFKKTYEETYGKSLGRASAIRVGDWQHAYAYLIQGKTEAAKDFQSLGSRAIEDSSTKEIKRINNSQNPPVKLISENELQDQIIKLTAYSTINLRFEVGIKNSFNTPDEASHRRWDWVEQLPRVVKVYELKARTISENDIKNTLYSKHYLELAAQKYNNKPIEFIFTSPNGISWEAKALIRELMNDQLGYTNIQGVKAKISFVDLQDISQRLVDNIVNNNPIESWFWLLNKLRTEDLNFVVSPRTISKLNSQVSQAYMDGTLVRKSINNVVSINSLDIAA
ncbi:hypothetical protein [Nostoc sp. UHCC 0870]|uniref:hypothetical protein n=1 Tax=Nostoc sp. UHCC 0870 TaxID=2914041 RepID=UPI001EDFA587|nr:hypothetical protein [Nostoc sp. UHCC 0870]UKO99376.1 hypothetical protein L6494_06585 [Nostoc sp. UHCC 0870]